MKSIIVLLFIVTFIPAFSQKQGICGKVSRVSGNQMPGPGATRTSPEEVQREIHVYELTAVSDTQQQDGLYTSINTRLITKVKTSKKGKFKIKLAPGTYSLFIKEDKGLFANLMDQNNHINPVTVSPKQFSQVDISINYEAAY